jgi:TP901 family phage tail tape measure protein/lambda family phage tail tape measure protein
MEATSTLTLVIKTDDAKAAIDNLAEAYKQLKEKLSEEIKFVSSIEPQVQKLKEQINQLTTDLDKKTKESAKKSGDSLASSVSLGVTKAKNALTGFEEETKKINERLAKSGAEGVALLEKGFSEASLTKTLKALDTLESGSQKQLNSLRNQVNEAKRLINGIPEQNIAASPNLANERFGPLITNLSAMDQLIAKRQKELDVVKELSKIQDRDEKRYDAYWKSFSNEGVAKAQEDILKKAREGAKRANAQIEDERKKGLAARQAELNQTETQNKVSEIFRNSQAAFEEQARKKRLEFAKEARLLRRGETGDLLAQQALFEKISARIDRQIISIEEKRARLAAARKAIFLTGANNDSLALQNLFDRTERKRSEDLSKAETAFLAKPQRAQLNIAAEILRAREANRDSSQLGGLAATQAARDLAAQFASAREIETKLNNMRKVKLPGGTPTDNAEKLAMKTLYQDTIRASEGFTTLGKQINATRVLLAQYPEDKVRGMLGPRQNLVTLVGQLDQHRVRVRESADSMVHWNQVAHESHSLARGLVGPFKQLWLTWGSLIPLAAGAALSGSTKAVFEIGKEIEYQLAFVSAVSGQAQISMSEFANATKNTLQTPVEAAGGLRILAQAGLDTYESISALPAVMRLATVAETDIGNAAKASTALMHTFGLEIGDIARIGDVFAKAAAVSATSVQEMMEAMKQASAIANVYGVSLEETAAALATLGNRGIEGSAAGTAIRNMIKEMAAPATAKAADAMKKFGINVFDANGEIKPFTENLKQLADVTNFMSDKAKARFLEDLFNERGAKAANILLTDLDKMKEALEEIRLSSEGIGFVSETQLKLAQTVKGQTDLLRADFQKATASIFEGVQPQFVEILSSLRDIVQSSGFKEFIENLVKILTSFTNALLENKDVIISLVTLYAGYKAAVLAVSAAKTAYSKILDAEKKTVDLLSNNTSILTQKTNEQVAAYGKLEGAKKTVLNIGVGLGSVALYTAAAAAIGYAISTIIEKYIDYKNNVDEATKAAKLFIAQQDKTNESLKSSLEKQKEDNAILAEKVRLMKQGVREAEALRLAEDKVRRRDVNASAILQNQTEVNRIKGLITELETKPDFYEDSQGQANSNRLKQLREELKLKEDLLTKSRDSANLSDTLVEQAKNQAFNSEQDRLENTRLSEILKLQDDYNKILNSEAEIRERISKNTGKGSNEKLLETDKKRIVAIESLKRLGQLNLTADTAAVKIYKENLQEIQGAFDEGRELASKGKKGAKPEAPPKSFVLFQDAETKLREALEDANEELAKQSISIDGLTKSEVTWLEISKAIWYQIAQLTVPALAEDIKLTYEKIIAGEKAKRSTEENTKAEKEMAEAYKQTSTAMRSSNEEIGKRVAKLREDFANIGLSGSDIARKEREKAVAEIKEVENSIRAIENLIYKDFEDNNGRGATELVDVLKAAEDRKAVLTDELDLKTKISEKEKAQREDWRTGWKQAFDEYKLSAENIAAISESTFSTAFKGMEDAIVQFTMTGKLSFRDMTLSILADIARIATRRAIVGGLAALFPGSTGVDTSVPVNPLEALGGVWESGIKKFAQGGAFTNQIVSKPTMFAHGGGFGLMGEAGPEAIMPLSRGRDGRLGVIASGSTGQNITIVNNINIAKGENSSDTNATGAVALALARQIEPAVMSILGRESLPGGLLYK